MNFGHFLIYDGKYICSPPDMLNFRIKIVYQIPIL